jgi:hypothetical protein
MPRKVLGGGKKDSLPRSAGQFPPGDELDVLLLKQLAKFLAGEEIEVALAPQVSRSRVAAFISSSAKAR